MVLNWLELYYCRGHSLKLILSRGPHKASMKFTSDSTILMQNETSVDLVKANFMGKSCKNSIDTLTECLKNIIYL